MNNPLQSIPEAKLTAAARLNPKLAVAIASELHRRETVQAAHQQAGTPSR